MANKGIDNEQTRSDIIAETVVRAMRAIDGFEGRSKFTTWAWGIYKITLADYFRKSNTQLPPHTQPIKVFKDDPGIEICDERQHDQSETPLLSALKKIASDPEDPDHKDAVFLIDFYDYSSQGKSQKDIAGMLGLKPNTFNQQLKRCRKALKKRLKEFMQ